MRCRSLDALHCVDFFRESRLAVGSLIAVDHAFGYRLVEFARRCFQFFLCNVFVTLKDRFTCLSRERPKFALDGAVALGCLTVRFDALNLRLDVCHLVLESLPVQMN